MDINITPALQIDERKNLSTEEFQKQLCSWLESKGLLTELRAYFRCNMIEVLKNTALGTSISCKSKQTISPKMQAMNLLISEYFMYSQYHFSLCVFCTEVSLNNMLPNVGSTGSLVSKEEINFKFTEKEVYDILEAIGFVRHNKRAQKIYTSYCELDEPLISYFLPSTSLTSNDNIDCFGSDGDLDYKIVSANIDNIITNSNMSPNEMSQLKYYINWICDKHNEKEPKLVETLKEQFRGQLKKYKSKLHDIQRSFDNERQKFEEDIKCMKQVLDNVLMQNRLMSQNQDQLQARKIVSLNEQLQQTEVEMDNKCTDAEVKVQSKVTQYVEEKLKPPTKIDKEQQTLTNVPLESAVLKHVVQQLEKENNILRGDNYNYCEQIDELAKRAAILMNELNISQQNVVRLNNLLQITPTVFTPSNYSGRQQTLAYTGAGEEYSGAFKQTTPSNYRNLSRGSKHSKKITHNSGSSSGSSPSPTDELLQEAKKRLKNLELESDYIDHNILSFTENYNLASNSNQNKHVQNAEKRYVFNNDPGVPEVRNVFEFGSSIQQKTSRTDTECTEYPSQTSCTNSNGSSYHLDDPQLSDED